MPLIEHFDLLAPLYDRLIPAPEDPPLSEHLGLPIDGWLLDAGGGTGRIANSLADEAGHTVLLDVSLPMLEQAEQKQCCHAVAASTEDPPFAAGTFDRIIVVDAFHHLADQELSLKRLWRTLDSGGRLVIEEPDIQHWGVRLVALFEKLALMRSRFVKGDDIASALMDLGGEVDLKQEGHTVWVIAEKKV